MDWIIYVAKATTRNFKIGLEEGIWGHKQVFSTVNTDKIKKGDILYFVHHLTLMKDELGKSVPGFPRVGAEHYNGWIQTLVKAEVTQDFYTDQSTRVWPDDLYPNRYRFKVLETHFNIPFGHEFFASSFVEAVRESTLRKGLAIELNGSTSDIYTSTENNDFEIFEGAPVYRRHVVRERNPEIVNRKKALVKAQLGKLVCEACNFDFKEVYGSRGEDYIECHHENPLSDAKGQTTHVNDLALLCSNCHKMIHRSRPWITVPKLKEIIHERTTRASD